MQTTSAPLRVSQPRAPAEGTSNGGLALASTPYLPPAWADNKPPPSPTALSAHPQHSRVRMELQIDLHYDIDQYGADFVFNIHAAQTPSQAVSAERLQINQDIPHHIHTDPATGNRYLRLHGQPGELNLSYRATVDITHHRADPTQLAEVPVRRMP